MTEARTLGDDWIEVFKQRGVWDLTPEIVQAWVERNATFFRFLNELVPPGGTVLEIGCGPGRHGIGAATQGFRVHGIDADPLIVDQARRNAVAVAPEAGIRFTVGDMLRLDLLDRPPGGYDAITHGGLMEHFPSAEAIRKSLRSQLDIARLIVFDVPIRSDKNLVLFDRDDIFRQVWTSEQWVHEVLDGLPVARWHEENHPNPNMTDDLVVALDRDA